VNPEVPKELDAIVKKALSARKEDRFESAQSFQLEIERYMETAGLKCSARDLGQWVSRLFADHRKETRNLIENQLSALRLATPRGQRMSSLPGESGAPGRGSRPDQSQKVAAAAVPPAAAMPRADDSVSRPDAVMARSHPGSVQPSTWTTGAIARWAFIGGAALVLVTVIVLALASPGGQGDGKTVSGTSGSASTGTPVTSASVAPLPVDIRISLSSPTPNAEFWIDDGPHEKGPLSVMRPRNSLPHRISVAAPGFRPETKNITFERDVVWNVSLLPVHGTTAGTPAPSANASTETPTPR
jgi:serine/threonine-protein kinase